MSIDAWRDAIAADAPHVLIYPEIGMDPTAAALAGLRLAAVQCTSWGHPNTSGYPTLDYYLSSDLMEPPNGASFYTERLVRLLNLSVYYEPLPVTPIGVTRAEYGLRESAKLYWCCQSLYKYLPQFDHVFPRIAQSVGDCQFVFIGQRRLQAVNQRFRKRLERAFAAAGLAAAEHCVMLPRLERNKFVAAAGLCDVALDSIGWSGSNTTLEGLAHNLPVVTMAGEFMRGRHTAAILTMMGLTETITELIDDYVAVAVRLSADAAWREAVREQIAANKRKVYRDRACIAALEAFLAQAARNPVVRNSGDNPFLYAGRAD